MELHNGLHEDDQRSAAVWDATGLMRKGTQRSKSLIPCCKKSVANQRRANRNPGKTSLYIWRAPSCSFNESANGNGGFFEIAMSTMS